MKKHKAPKRKATNNNNKQQQPKKIFQLQSLIIWFGKSVNTHNIEMILSKVGLGWALFLCTLV